MNFKFFKVLTDTDPEGKKYTHMFGSYISLEDNELLTLCSLFRKTSKSMLFREILADWFYRIDISLDIWIDRIAEQCYHIWCADYKSLTNGKQGLAAFRKALRQDLKSRNLSDDVVEKIIKKFDDFNK